MIHKGEIRFNIKFTIRGNMEGRKYLGINLHHGEMYILPDVMYLGGGRRWFRISLEDLAEVVQPSSGAMQLVFPDYEVNIFSSNPHQLRAILHLLTFYTLSMKPGGTAVGGAG